MKKQEISSLKDIKILVDNFYEKVRNDAILKDIFNNRIQNKWPVRLEKMYSFWQTVLLNKHTYSGSPLLPHSTLSINLSHFKRWQKLFNETIDENFVGPKTIEAKKRAEMMATMFNYKIEHIKNKSATAKQ